MYRKKKFHPLCPLNGSRSLNTDVYAFQCGECDRHYIGETGRRVDKIIDEHLTTDKKSHVYKHVAQTGYVINEEDFSIIGSGYGNYKKRKI